MNSKEKKRHYIYEALTFLVVLAVLTFVCRLWPLLLLIILGIFIATIRLVFLSSKNIEIIEPLPMIESSRNNPKESDVYAFAAAVISNRITELVAYDYPQARWIWESPNVRKAIESEKDLFIRLNRAGGYSRARVHLSNLKVIGIEYLTQQLNDTPHSNFEDIKESQEEQTEIHDFGLLAFEWVDAHIIELNERCNEAIGKGLYELTIPSEELPIKESWLDICKELERADLKNVSVNENGITINLA